MTNTTARDLTSRLAGLLTNERAALAEFLLTLAEFDEGKLWLELGHASLFYFLHRELGLSKGAAFYRKTAAELVRKHPEVVAPLRDGRLCLTSVVELSKVLTAENRDEVLPRFFQLSKREAKAVSAALRPAEAAPHREVLTAVRTPASAATLNSAAATKSPCPSPELASLALSLEPAASPRALAPSPDREQGSVHPDEPGHASSVRPGLPADGAGGRDVKSAPPSSTAGARSLPSTSGTRVPSSSSEPLTADLSRLHVTVSRRFLAKLEAARKALSHSHPGASADEILEAGLDLLLERHAKRKGLVTKPRREPPPAKPEHVPAHVRRAVWERDGGRCQWALDGGGVCGSTHRVELDHVVPRGRGGPSTIDNLRILCRVHNEFAARQVYGDSWMDRFKRATGVSDRSRSSRPRPPVLAATGSTLPLLRPPLGE